MRQRRLANEPEYSPRETGVSELQRTSSQPFSRETQAVPRQPLRERVATAILEAAARALVDQGAHASMNEVAAEAGIARATVYRYFPSRQALLDALAELAVNDAGARLSSARMEQGQRSGAIRDDLPTSWLTESLVGLVVTVLLASPTMGQEDTIAAIVSLFVDGIRARGEESH